MSDPERHSERSSATGNISSDWVWSHAQVDIMALCTASMVKRQREKHGDGTWSGRAQVAAFERMPTTFAAMQHSDALVNVTVTYPGIVCWSKQRLREEAEQVRTLTDYRAYSAWRDRVADRAAKAYDEHQANLKKVRARPSSLRAPLPPPPPPPRLPRPPSPIYILYE